MPSNNPPTVAQLFNDKAQKNAELGAPQQEGNIPFDQIKNQFIQRFEGGVLYGKASITSGECRKNDIVCVCGPIWKRIEQQDVSWLGSPVEDSRKGEGYEGHVLVRQRFENGVVWYREDEPEDVRVLASADLKTLCGDGGRMSIAIKSAVATAIIIAALLVFAMWQGYIRFGSNI